jgi:ubiquinone/menaquinone biosynthesis C-methylase UbiE
MTKMGKTEKWFMNRPKHNINAIYKIEGLLQYVDFKENQKFLEIGCGNGSACKHVAKKYNFNVTGVDVDPEQIQNAKKDNEKIQNISFFEGDSTNLKFSDNEYDIVYSSGVLHHIRDWMHVLDEINRVLKHKGYYIFSDLAYSRFTKRLFKNISKNYGFYIIEDIIDFMKNKNFQVVQQEKPKGKFLKAYSIIFRKL